MTPSRGHELSSHRPEDLRPRPVLEVRDLTVSYRETVALQDASLTVDSGRVCGLVGMNGSGKSTLIKAVIGMVTPRSGSVSILGESPSVARKNGTVAYVPQAEDVDNSFPLSVRDVVMMGRYGHQSWIRRSRPADRVAVRDALERVELTDLARRGIGELSGGQRKRAFVARGLAQGASVLLLDEPFAGVDKRSEATIVALLRELAAEGATVLVATHDLHALDELCDEAALLHRTVLLHDRPEVVLRPENLALAFGLDPLARAGRSRTAVGSEAVGGEAADGEAVGGEAVGGEAVGGEAVDGEAVDGEAVDGEAVAMRGTGR